MTGCRQKRPMLALFGCGVLGGHSEQARIVQRRDGWNRGDPAHAVPREPDDIEPSLAAPRAERQRGVERAPVPPASEQQISLRHDQLARDDSFTKPRPRAHDLPHVTPYPAPVMRQIPGIDPDPQRHGEHLACARWRTFRIEGSRTPQGGEAAWRSTYAAYAPRQTDRGASDRRPQTRSVSRL